jgi:hypothetical protein
MMGGMALPGGGFGFGAGSKGGGFGGGFGGGGVRAPAMSGGGGGGMMPGRGLRGGAAEAPAPHLLLEDDSELAQALKQLGLVFKIYAGENEGLYPPLSPERGVFKPDLGALLPHFLSDPELIQLLEPYGQPEVIYLGHALGDTEQALAFLEAYEQVEPPLWQKDLEVNGHDSRVFHALREGIERFFITDINNPAAGAQAQSDLPVLWELPEPGADSGWVLFMDGHVQEVPLGDFPLTPELNERLRGMLRE